MHYEMNQQALNKLDELLNAGEVPTNLFAAIPELAKQVRVTQVLKHELMSRRLDKRVRCAEILDLIGDPAGVEHLVYNALVNHPKLNYRQLESKGWPGTVFRVADKLNALQVSLLIDDMVEYQVFHGPTLAFVNPEWVVPDMLKLLNHTNTVLQEFAAYVLAFHEHDEGAQQLMDWANNSPFPIFPLEALLQLSGSQWTHYLQSFINPQHRIYQNERYQGYAQSKILPMVSRQLAIKNITTSHDRAKYMIDFYGRTLNEVEVYSGTADGARIIRRLEPPVTVLKKPSYPSQYFAQDLLVALKDEDLQHHLADQQRLAVKQLIERADLVFENLLDAAIFTDFMSGMNRVRNIQPTGFLDRDRDLNFYSHVPVKIYYDMDDYLDSATDWILNPLKHRSPAFRMNYL